MALTGKKRSLTVKITKTLAGELVAGYPKMYYGLQAFTHNGNQFAEITSERMALMPVADYENRLARFKAYVQAQEAGLIIDNVQTNQAYY